MITLNRPDLPEVPNPTRPPSGDLFSEMLKGTRNSVKTSNPFLHFLDFLVHAVKIPGELPKFFYVLSYNSDWIGRCTKLFELVSSPGRGVLPLVCCTERLEGVSFCCRFPNYDRGRKVVICSILIGQTERDSS